MRKSSEEDGLLIGKVIGPHGLKGILRISSYAESVESFLQAGMVCLRTVSGKKQNYRILAIQPGGKNFLLKLEGVKNIEEAESLKGAELIIRRRNLGRLEAGAYYWADIIGLNVFLEDGRSIGKVTHIFNNGGHDIYVIKQGPKERLIPAVHELVKVVDPREGKMIIAAREDMLDLNAI